MSDKRKKWSKEEDNLLRSVYPCNSKSFIQEKFSDKVWSSIRYRAWSLGITRDQNLVRKDNLENGIKAFREKHGVNSSFCLAETKEKIKKTHLMKRGCEYPTQSKEVRAKICDTVQNRYGTSNVFQSEDIKKKISETNFSIYGVANPNQCPEIHAKAVSTNLKKYGVENPFKMVDRVKSGMLAKHGYTSALKSPKIREQWVKTNFERYGVPYPSQNDDVRKKLSEAHQSAEVREKKLQALRLRGHNPVSKEEEEFAIHLTDLYGDALPQEIHPLLKYSMDFYIPSIDMWIQYDGDYWHGRNGVKDPTGEGRQALSIRNIMDRDKIQNETIPNLVRFWGSDVSGAVDSGTISYFIRSKIEEKIKSTHSINNICHQYRKKLQHIKEDTENLCFNYNKLRAHDFTLSNESLSVESSLFISKYEWLGNIGFSPKWCFTARYQGILAGVVLINEPIAYSAILGRDTDKYEALMQRGATISWAPKNLGSRLVMYACRWMTHNTDKRAFVAYSDPGAGERGIIYQACNFEYLGDNFGDAYVYRHQSVVGAFSSRSLRRTSSFIKWCKENNIKTEISWFKGNGYKDMSNIPEDVKRSWYVYTKKIISESTRIPIPRKKKYALVLGRDRRDQKFLNSLKMYKGLPYVKSF